MHLTAVGPDYVLTIQGPEAAHLTRMLLDYVDALKDRELEKRSVH